MQNYNPNREQVYVSDTVNVGEVHIHVTGYMMPSAVFLKILDVMKLYYEKKTVVFVVYHTDMEQLVRESIPKQFYDRIDLRRPEAFETREGLRRAG